MLFQRFFVCFISITLLPEKILVQQKRVFRIILAQEGTFKLGQSGSLRCRKQTVELFHENNESKIYRQVSIVVAGPLDVLPIGPGGGAVAQRIFFAHGFAAGETNRGLGLGATR